MALASCTTERIQLSTDVTNPVTRHPAVTAAAIASIQEASEGRAVLGIGREDSALAFVGHTPAYVRVLDSYLKALQAYLNGSSVPFEDLTYWRGMAPPVDTLKLADTPADSRLRWLDSRDRKVPVAVAASGPRVIGLSKPRMTGRWRRAKGLAGPLSCLIRRPCRCCRRPSASFLKAVTRMRSRHYRHQACAGRVQDLPQR